MMADVRKKKDAKRSNDSVPRFAKKNQYPPLQQKKRTEGENSTSPKNCQPGRKKGERVQDQEG